LASSNGLFVNSVRRSEALLEPGDVVRCGEWVAIVARHAFSPVPFGEIAPGWYGGETIRSIVQPARKAAVTDLPVVVQGKTGTGKEGFARAIHFWSGRSGRFVAVNCAALPAHLAEGELFGYRKGAFTGADRSSPGLFRAAQGGTIFLDEILDLPPEVQPKLLRVLEQREVLPLGEVRPVPIDARIIVAAQESLFDAVQQGRFRSDLYARLDGLVIDLPVLRDRKEDIGPLFALMLKQYGGEGAPQVEPKVIETLCLYDWPLNVRELALLARQLLATHGDEQVLRRTHIPDRIVGRERVDGGSAGTGLPKRTWRKTDDKSELKALLDALRTHTGNVARAAEAIGVSRARAYRLLRAHPDVFVDLLGRDR
jgi:transcriptional regulator with PAS, ATPase and Fis domain